MYNTCACTCVTLVHKTNNWYIVRTSGNVTGGKSFVGVADWGEQAHCQAP